MEEKLEMRVMELQKQVEELSWRTSNRMPEQAEMRGVLELMKEFGVQRINIGNVHIEMPYRPELAGSSVAQY